MRSPVSHRYHMHVWPAGGWAGFCLLPTPLCSCATISLFDVTWMLKVAVLSLHGRTDKHQDSFSDVFPSSPNELLCSVGLIQGCSGSLDGNSPRSEAGLSLGDGEQREALSGTWHLEAGREERNGIFLEPDCSLPSPTSVPETSRCL